MRRKTIRTMDKNKIKRIKRIYNGARIAVLLAFFAWIIYGALTLNAIS